MTRGVRWYLVSSLVLVALIALAGCSHYLLAEREPWRHEAELSCLNSGAVKETPEHVRISAVGGSAPLSYDDEPVRPPSAIPNASTPNAAMPQRWPGAQPGAMPSSPIQ